MKTKSALSRKPKTTKTKAVKNSKRIDNGAMGDALFGTSMFGPQTGVQLSQLDTLFRNNRWYLISNMRQILNEIYVEIGLVQTIVDVPVDDGMRGGIEIKSKQLSEDQVQELTDQMERENDLEKIGRALKWNRLFGGAGIVIATDQKMDTPLDISKIKEDSPLEFIPVDMWELFWDHQNIDEQPIQVEVEPLDDGKSQFYSYYSKKLHRSRVMAMKGMTPPSFIRPRLRGWGFSVVESLVRSINQYLKATDLTFEVLDEFKVDVFKIKNLNNSLLSPQGAMKVRERVQLANREKNYQNAITMDSEDEYEHKQLSFAGLAEVMQGIRMQVASDMRMPLTKLFGISAQGFSSGEDDIENYNAMIESQVRQKAKYDILRVIEIRCQKLFGFRPDDLTIDFKPLRILSAEQEENVKTQKFNRALQAKTAGELTTKEFRDICNRDNLLGIQLDTTAETIGTGQDDLDEAPVEGEDQAGPEPVSVKAPKAKSTPKEAPTAKNDKSKKWRIK